MMSPAIARNVGVIKMKGKRKQEKQLTLALYRKNMIKFGQFQLTSGKSSPYYIDLRKLISFPQLMKKVAKMFLARKSDVDVVVGIATGGIPLSSFISAMGDIPGAYVRKETKEHGTSKSVEGVVQGKKALLIDDVTTTGGSLLHGVTTLRRNNAIIEDAFVVVNREEGAVELLKEHDVALHALLNISTMIEILDEEALIERAESQAVKTYLYNNQ